MAFPTYSKDPDEVLDYAFKFAAYSNPPSDGKGSTVPTEDLTDYLESGETISSKTVTAETGITVDSDTLIDSNTGVRVVLSGGTAGESYDVACKVSTSGGTVARTVERTITISVAER